MQSSSDSGQGTTLPWRPAAIERSTWISGAIIAALAGWAGLWRMGTTTILFDEPIYASAGRQYLDGDLTGNLEHPPVAKYLFGLAQELLGEGISAARVASGLASVVIALVVWRLAEGMVGRSVGLAAAGLWIALPKSIGSNEAGTPGDRLERFAYLEPLTAMFMIIAIWFGWRLHRSRGWGDTIGLGLAVGLATATKLSGASIAVPVVVFLLVVVGRSVLVRLAVAGLVSLLTFFAAYAPFGLTANEAISYMYTFQTDHGASGHAVFVRGHVTSHPPWFTELWYHLDADGPWLTAAVVTLVALAFVADENRRASAYLLGSVVAIYIFLSLMPIEIRHYRYVVWPPLVVLMAIGLSNAASAGLRSRALGAMAVAVVIAVGAASLVGLAFIGPEDYAALDAALVERGVDSDARIVIYGPGHVAATYLPGRPLSTGSGPVGPDQADVVLVDSTFTVRSGHPEVVGVVDSFRLGRVEVLILG